MADAADTWERIIPFLNARAVGPTSAVCVAIQAAWSAPCVQFTGVIGLSNRDFRFHSWRRHVDWIWYRRRNRWALTTGWANIAPYLDGWSLQRLHCTASQLRDLLMDEFDRRWNGEPPPRSRRYSEELRREFALSSLEAPRPPFTLAR